MSDECPPTEATPVKAWNTKDSDSSYLAAILQHENHYHLVLTTTSAFPTYESVDKAAHCFMFLQNLSDVDAEPWHDVTEHIPDSAVPLKKD